MVLWLAHPRITHSRLAQIELWRDALREIEVEAIVNAQNVQPGGS